MRVYAQRVHETGDPEVLRYEEVALPAPGPGEALVRHTAIGVNFIDVYHVSGLYPLPSLPHGIGVEAAGVVETVGDDVHGVRPGDRVAWVTRVPGTYAEGSVVEAAHLVPLPPGVSDEVAAATLLKGMTVEMLIHRVFDVEPGMTVLLHAAAGGVGLLACQWLAHRGARVLGTVGTRDKAQLALEHGCARAIVSGEEDFVDVAMEETDGRGVPVVYDSVGRDTVARSLDALAPRGTLVTFGNASGAPAPIDPLRLGRSSLSVTRPSLFDYIRAREELLGSAAALFRVLEEGAVRGGPAQTWPLAAAPAALQALASRQTTGASLLIP